MASPAGGRITPLPSNEFYQSPFDGRWVDMDEAEVFRLIDMQRERISGTHEKAVPVVDFLPCLKAGRKSTPHPLKHPRRRYVMFWPTIWATWTWNSDSTSPTPTEDGSDATAAANTTTYTHGASTWPKRCSKLWKRMNHAEPQRSIHKKEPPHESVRT